MTVTAPHSDDHSWKLPVIPQIPPLKDRLRRQADGVARGTRQMVVLVVGFEAGYVPHLPEDLHDMGAHYEYVAFHKLTLPLIAHIEPDLVISPLFNESFDAVEIARRLEAAGFCGRYVALAPNLPNPGVVAREVRALTPCMQFELYSSASGF